MLKVASIDISFFGNRVGESKVYEKDKTRITCFVKDGILKGIILINAKPFLMKARNGIDKPFSQEDFKL